MPSVRIRDIDLVNALIRCVMNTPDSEMPMVAEYVLGFPVEPSESGDYWKVDTTGEPAVLSIQRLKGGIYTTFLNAEPAQLRHFANDLLGVEAEYDKTEWFEWLVTPNDDYAGCFDIELGIRQPKSDAPEEGVAPA